MPYNNITFTYNIRNTATVSTRTHHPSLIQHITTARQNTYFSPATYRAHTHDIQMTCHNEEFHISQVNEKLLYILEDS